MPAISNAARDASTVGGVSVRSSACDWLKTSNEPNGLVFTLTAFRKTGLRTSSFALSARHRIIAQPPSAGEQNMYLRNGWHTICEVATSS